MKKIFFLLSIYLFNIQFAQIYTISENISAENYSIDFTSGSNNNFHSDTDWSEFFNPSEPGSPILPHYDIFISLPIIENPTLQYSIIELNTINKTPELNKEFYIASDSTINSKNASYKKVIKPFLEIKGYLWINDYYCMHLEINPVKYDNKNEIIEFVDKFNISLKFSKNIEFAQKERAKKAKIILNSPFKIQNKSTKFPIKNMNDWIDYNSEYLKLGTNQDGIYRITYNDLIAENVNLSLINPKTLKIFMNGTQIPIFIEGEDDLSFDETDFIEFVGIKNMGGKHREESEFNTPYNEYLGRYTDTTIYWLTWNGENGIRVENLTMNITSTSDTLYYYSQIDHYESNPWFDFTCQDLTRRESPFWIENKTWIWGGISPGTRSFNFTVNSAYPNKPFQMYFKAQGWVSDINDNAYHISLSLNSYPEAYDSTYFSKYDQVVLSAELNSNLLTNNATNNLKVNSYVTNASLNTFFYDWYEIEYPRYLKPFSDSLLFSFPFLDTKDLRNIKITDINSNNFTIWKYGDEFKRFNLNQENNELLFSDSVSSYSKYVLLDSLKIMSPYFYYLKQFTNLRNNENQADYLIITHSDFITKAYEYAEFIASNYNVTTKVINVNDIYDEFDYGFFNPEAIQDFLKITHNNWKEPLPQYVLLLGDASYDYHNNKHIYQGFEYVKNYVPSFGAPVSDNWFVTWDTTGAYIPQMNIGRLPVKSNDEIDWYLEKHQQYLSGNYDEWNKKYLFFSGGNENDENQLNSMKEVNDFIIENYVDTIPIGGNYTHFYKTIEPKTNFGPYSLDFVESEIDKGSLFISYLGHSGTQTWDNSIISPTQLGNSANRFPLITDFGCSTGKFAEPDIVAFAELFTIDAEGQAIGYIGNSSLGFTSTSLTVPKIFYKKILQEGFTEISEAHKQAKLEMLQNYGSSGSYSLFALTNEYFGDPIISLPIPEKPNFKLLSENIELLNDNITDLDDSSKIKISYNNLGKVSNDSVSISIIHNYVNTKSSYPKSNKEELILKRPIPKYSDSLVIPIYTKDQPGNHTIIVTLDNSNSYNEISEDDNTANYNFVIASSSTRNLIDYYVENGIKNRVKILNPTVEPPNSTIILELSENQDFSSQIISEYILDTIFTEIPISISNGNRYWYRSKIKNSENYSISSSFLISDSKYFLKDSISFLNSSNNNLTNLGSLKIDSSYINFHVVSAGFNDGNTAVNERNSVNTIPEATLRGHHVSVFSSEIPYNFIEYKLFDVLSGGSNLTNYTTFLDTLSNDRILLFSISDHGSITDANLLNKIKQYGSKYIDSVDFRASWAFIGKKGAAIGSMPEAFSHQGDGFVQIDTTISYLSDSGSLLTSQIGKATKWKSLNVQQNLISNSQITYTPLGIRENGEIDTLQQFTVQDSTADLSFIDAKIYPQIKLLAQFSASDDKISPELYSLGVDYVGIAELAINYQVVSVEKDSVEQGENEMLNFSVYNVGENSADSFWVSVKLRDSENNSFVIFTQLVDSISAESKRNFSVSQATANLSGEYSFEISIDDSNKVVEHFKDNNYYSIPFFVKADTTKPSINLLIDQKDILNGEFISPTPEIIISISDESILPITDTSSVIIKLNGQSIYANNPDIEIEINQSNPKYVVTFTPTLQNGDYTLFVNGKDANGNIALENGITKSFKISNQLQLMDVYNYPNPFANETYFTFKLPQIPDEMEIKIFTVAGRLIKSIKANSSELDYDFNKLFWDGKDEDGDEIANGTYFYKIIMKKADETITSTGKLAKIK